jgi:hypothetical protein
LGQDPSQVDEVLDFINQTDYSAGRGVGQWVLTSAKVAKMQSMYNASVGAVNIGYFDNKSSLPFIIGISLVGLTSIAGLYILKKKRA